MEQLELLRLHLAAHDKALRVADECVENVIRQGYISPDVWERMQEAEAECMRVSQLLEAK
jgi:hypothetical protein